MAEEPTGLDEVRDLLRDLPVLKGDPPPFEPDAAPDEPVALFVEWLSGAVRAGVREPHAMTVSTVDQDGRPNARVLILKDVDAGGWHFAVSAVSRKGAELAARPAAALTFYWPELIRQVRISGPVIADPAAVSAADFLARSTGSREMALTRRQSQPFVDPAEVDEALEKSRLELAADPRLVPAEWISYAVRPRQVEFWQGDPSRRHVRLRYEFADDAWSHVRLWP
jgi:pyridoxamine 5'-phosphate oxidase